MWKMVESKWKFGTFWWEKYVCKPTVSNHHTEANLPSLKLTVRTWNWWWEDWGSFQAGANVWCVSGSVRKKSPRFLERKLVPTSAEFSSLQKTITTHPSVRLSNARYQWNITSFLVGNAATQLCLDFQAAIPVSQDFCWCISAVTSASILAPTTTVQYHIYHVYLFLFFPAAVDCL